VKKLLAGFEKREGFLGILEKLNKYSATENVSAVKGFTLPELARITGISWEKMREWVRVLEKMGVIERFGVGRFAVYSIKIGKNRLMLMR
jgi:predicted transcriptional regulator of viral defense system